jgi:hypothetical protein
MGTADGARIGVSMVIFMSGDWDVMALYLGSEGRNRKGYCRPCESRDPQPPMAVVAASCGSSLGY